MKSKIAILLAICIHCTGCASYVATQNHNARLERGVLALRIQDSGDMTLGADLLGMRGYLGAWKEAPGKMTMVTLADAALAYGAYELYEKDREEPEVVYVPVSVTASVYGEVGGDVTINMEYPNAGQR